VLSPDLEFGDLGDGRFNNCLCEYWYSFFSGSTAFNDLHSFYPCTDSLAWSDILLGFGLPYSLFRLFGADMFLAYKITCVLILALGLYAMFWLMRGVLGFGAGASFLGAVIVYCSSTVASLVIHTQLLFISWIPVTTIFIVRYLRNCAPGGATARRRIYGCLAVMSFGLEFLTAFYVAYFHFLILLVMALWWAVLSLVCRRGFWGRLWAYLRRFWYELFIYIACALVWLIPTLNLYLPVIRKFGARSSDSVLSLSPNIFELMLTRQKSGIFYNTVMAVYNRFAPSFSGIKYGESYYGLAAVSLLLLAAASVYFLVCLIAGLCRRRSLPWVPLLGIVSVLAFWSMYLTIVSNGHTSFWLHLMRFIPAAGSIRAISRLIAFLSLPAAVSVACMFEDMAKRLGGKKRLSALPRILAVIFAALVVFGAQPDYYTTWTASSQRAMLAAVPQPPAECRTMFIYSVKDSDAKLFAAQLDSWLIALDKHIDTINGYSGEVPSGWNIMDLTSPDYLDNVAAWVKLNGIDTRSLYMYNVQKHEWISCEKVIEPN
jgi:hypothetical protein